MRVFLIIHYPHSCLVKGRKNEPEEKDQALEGNRLDRTGRSDRFFYHVLCQLFWQPGHEDNSPQRAETISRRKLS